MSRNFKKEADWERQKYKRYQYRCPKAISEQFEKKRKAEGMTFSALAKKAIEGFLKGEK